MKGQIMPTGKYWDISRNFIGGCSPCSVGCTYCWAADCASKRLANHPLYEGLTKNGKWTGEVRVMPELIKVIGGKPKTIFWCNMADMFHEKVGFEDVDQAFAAMALMPQHKHLVLTKRIERMAEYCGDEFRWAKHILPEVDKLHSPWQSPVKYFWPQPHIHLGVTICTPEELWKARELCEIPAANRWISFEPLLGPIDFRRVDIYEFTCDCDAGVAFVGDYYPERGYKTNGHFDPNDKGWDTCCNHCGCEKIRKLINKVVIGCESGPKRRLTKPEWIRSIVEQCQAAGIPWLVKQVEINGKVIHDPQKCNEFLGV